MSSGRNRKDRDDGRRDSYDDDYERQDSYSGNGNGYGYADSYGGNNYDREAAYRPRNDYDEKPRRSSEKRHRSPDDRSRRSSKHDRGSGGKDHDHHHSKDETPLEKVKNSFGGSEESYIATGVGAVAGAFLGGEAMKGKEKGPLNGPVATILGAVLGGLSANAIDKQYEMRKERRKDEERRGDDYRHH